MVRYPREEISYTKLYKDLDLDKPLGIEWPTVSEPKEVVAVYETQDPPLISPRIRLDTRDKQFCEDMGIETELLERVLNELEELFDSKIYSELKGITPLKPDEECDICGSDDVPDELVACNGCGITVHQGCYGIEGFDDPFWFCVRCIFLDWTSPCILCGKEDGIFKRTEDNRWVHAVCASIHPKLSFSNLVYKDPVEVFLLKPVQGTCVICNLKSSSLVKCSYYNCTSKFHSSCASEYLYCDLNNRRIYCQDHDFSKIRTTARRGLLEHRMSYAELENEIFMRRPMKLQAQKNTEFKKIVKIDPETVEWSGNKEIFQHWVKRRRKYGCVFNGIFKYTSYINNNFS